MPAANDKMEQNRTIVVRQVRPTAGARWGPWM